MKASLDAAMGKEETIAAIESLAAKVESGETTCAALRLFLADGSWEDAAIGGTAVEKALALDNMRKHAQVN